MKRLLTLLALSLAAATSFGATLNPVQLLNPAGSTSGQAIVSTGPSSAPAWGNVTASGLSPVAANSIIANFTGSTAAPVAFSMPTCSSAGRALQYSGSGIVCTANYALTTGTLAQFAATTSAQLAGILSDETGSGALVFGTSPAIGTPTISGGTISNAPISGSTGAFTTLSASSTVSGTGFSAYFASPPAIGGTTPAAGTFTALKGNSLAKVFATNTSGQSIPNNSVTTVTGWTTVRDANSNFVASTGIFTAPATADYMVCGQLVISGTMTVNNIVEMTILGNAVSVAVANFPVSSASVTDNTVSGCADVFVSSGQTITVQALQNSGGALPLATAAKQIYLSIVQLP